MVGCEDQLEMAPEELLPDDHLARNELVMPRSALYPSLLLATLLLLGSEMLIWTNPPARDLLGWLLLLPGYWGISALLLDFIVRYRVRDLFGVLMLAGLYSLLAALTLNPDSMLIDFSRTLITRVMGSHALLGAEMLGLFLALTGNNTPRSRRYLLIGAVIVGLAWGFWGRGWPPSEGFAEVSLSTFLLYSLPLIGLALLMVYRLPYAADMTPESLRLSRRGWMLVLIVLLSLFAYHLLRTRIDGGILLIVGLLLVLCWSITWYRGRRKGETLLDGRIPPQPPPLSVMLRTLGVFLLVGVIAFSLPPLQVGSITPVVLIGLGFTGYGLAWLPTVALVLGVRGYLRQVGTKQL